MINIKELKLFLGNNFGNTGQIHIKYLNNKPEFVGYVHKMDDETLNFTMIKMTVKNGTDPYCDIDFENIKRIEIEINGTTQVKIFE